MILGSRNPQGQTATAADALLEGVGQGHRSETSPNAVEIERVFLPELSIERCRQCEDSGWGICRTEGRCVIEDDFAVLVDQIHEADAVAFATPVYFSDLSESMRAFLDRLRRISRHEDGRRDIEGKRAVGICVAGGGGGGAPECTVSLKKVLRTSGFDVVDMVPVRRQNLDMKVDVLKTVGVWLVNTDG
jgi:multimeric flavodoxin WrbA